MQLSPHKIDTTSVSSFVARTTRFNSCVYFIGMILQSNPKGKATKTNPLSSTIFQLSSQAISQQVDIQEDPWLSELLISWSNSQSLKQSPDR